MGTVNAPITKLLPPPGPADAPVLVGVALSNTNSILFYYTILLLLLLLLFYKSIIY